MVPTHSKQLLLYDEINRARAQVYRHILSERKRKIMKDKKKYHGTVDEHSSEQQFRKSDTITFVVLKNLEPCRKKSARTSVRKPLHEGLYFKIQLMNM